LKNLIVIIALTFLLGCGGDTTKGETTIREISDTRSNPDNINNSSSLVGSWRHQDGIHVDTYKSNGTITLTKHTILLNQGTYTVAGNTIVFNVNGNLGKSNFTISSITLTLENPDTGVKHFYTKINN